MRTTRRAFAVLVGDACLDAVRRRIVPLVAAISILSLFAVDSCTSCTPTVVSDGQVLDVKQIAGWSSLLIFAVLSLWTMVLGGVLASDHLSSTLDDGTASLILARPVSRRAFAAARLAGALTVAFATGIVLLSGAALLIHARVGLEFQPAIWGALACGAGTFIVGTLAMLVSLLLPQPATVLLVLAGVGSLAAANAIARFSEHVGGLVGSLDRVGPPLLTAVAVALAPWMGAERPPGAGLALAARLALWSLVSLVALVIVFRSEEIR